MCSIYELYVPASHTLQYVFLEYGVSELYQEIALVIVTLECKKFALKKSHCIYELILPSDRQKKNFCDNSK